MNNDTHFDFIIIGSGPSGQKAAVQAAKYGKKVAVIEMERAIGGACVHCGTIPSKTLREAALELFRIKNHSATIDGNLKENVEVNALMTRLGAVTQAHDDFINKQIDRNSITRFHGRASFISGSSIRVRHLKGDDTVLTGETIFIATGSKPRDPSDINIDHEHILDSDSILSLLYLPKSLTILGGGVIACEYASIFAILGVEVTLIDRYPKPLGFLDHELIDKFLDTYTDCGGTFIGGPELNGVVWDGMSQVVTTLSDGQVIKTDKLLFALGRVANVDFLQLENTGIALNERGLIPVDRNLRTKVDNIYAVGDVIGPPSLASASMEQGRRACCHALGVKVGSSSETSPIGIYTIPEISTVGLTEDEAKNKWGGAMVGRAEFGEVARGQISGTQNGLLKLVADADGRKLLGAQIVGEGATELIHIAQMGLLSGVEIDIFIENIFNFPTLAEAYRVAALQIAGTRSAVTTLAKSA